MDIKELLKLFQNILKVTDAIELELDLGYTKAVVLMLLFKKIANHLKVDPEILWNESKADFQQAMVKLNNLIIDEFNEETEEHGPLSKQILKTISSILKSEKPIQDINIIELLEKVNDIGIKIQTKLGEDFLSIRDTTNPGNQESSSITEIESKMSRKKEKKA